MKVPITYLGKFPALVEFKFAWHIYNYLVHISRNNYSIQFSTDCSLLKCDHYL